MKHVMLKGGQGANIQNINQQILPALGVPIPPIELQCEFSLVVKSYRLAEKRAQLTMASSGELFNSLSQKAFSG